MSASSLVIESDWILPVESPAIRGGFLVIEAGRILHVAAHLPERFCGMPKVRLSGGAILPGLINAHCHLELSDIDQPLPVPQSDNGTGSMVGWLDKLMARRRDLVDSKSHVERIKQEAIELGIRQAWESGTRFVVDNVTAPWSAQWCEQSARGLCKDPSSEAYRALVPEIPIHIQPCIELVDVNQTRCEQTWEFAKKLCEQQTTTDRVCRQPFGLAPHAPYTASKRMVQQAVRFQSARHGLLSMHLAESLEELEYVERSKGPLKFWISPWVDKEHVSNIGKIDEYLRLLLEAHRSLIAHGNYLSESQIDWIGEHRDKVAVVYCPRTHIHFRHKEHPARSLAGRGVNVFLGTDSRCSNPDLSLFEEWKTACRMFPDLGARYWMEQCTTSPAKFLEIDQWVGTIRQGSKSLLTWVPLGGQEIADEDQLWQAMLDSHQAIPLEVHVFLMEMTFR